MPGDALEIGPATHEGLEDLVLLLIAGLQGHAVLPVALGVVVFVLPQVIGLDAEEHVHIGQQLGAVVPGLIPAPEQGAEVAVKAHGEALFLGLFDAGQDKVGAALGQGGGDAAQMQPVIALQQRIQVHPGKVVFGDGTVLAVIGHLAGADAVAGLQIVGAQAVGGGLLRAGEDHRGAVHVVGAEHAHRALAQGVVGHHAEEGAVDAQVCQGQGDIGLAAAVAGLEAGGHPDLLIVGRGQAQHDLPEGDEFLRAFAAQQGIVVFHLSA